jgi:hypothetical protein
MAELETTKCLLNSTISTLNARFCSMDITNFYLHTPMERPEFVRIPAHLIPEEIMEEYHLEPLVHQGMVLAIVVKGMYGLLQAGALANVLLKQHLDPHGYFECVHTPGLWQHQTQPIMFALVVDEFGTQYAGKEHVDHLLETLLRDYEAIMVDWCGSLFCGITLDWNYRDWHVTLSMPGYVQAALEEFKHPLPAPIKNQPYLHVSPQYGVVLQLTDSADDSPLLDDEGYKQIQRLTGKFLYFAWVVDSTMLVALSTRYGQNCNCGGATHSDVAI